MNKALEMRPPKDLNELLTRVDKYINAKKTLAARNEAAWKGGHKHKDRKNDNQRKKHNQDKRALHLKVHHVSLRGILLSMCREPKF